MPKWQNIGGVARRATVINRIRQENRNVYCFDAGDNMDGTLFSTEYHDRADYAMINAMAYDYCVTGNHEYSLKADSLRAIVSNLVPKLVLANVRDRKTHALLGREYVIDNWSGVKVAIAGLVTSETRSYPGAREAFDVEDPVEVAKRLVPELRTKADLVILVTHVGIQLDQKIASDVPGVDVIVGGHSHTRLPHGLYQTALRPGPTDPKGTIIVQTGAWGGELGRLDLTVERKKGRWSVAAYRDTLIALTAAIPGDPVVSKVVNYYWHPLQRKYRDTVGVALADFTDFENAPSTNYYLVSDACTEIAKCQFSLQNVGGVRAPLLAGPVTRFDLASMMPFDDTLYTATISGASLDSVLNETFAQPSAGLHYTIHHWKADSATRTNERWVVREIAIQGRPIHPDSIYSVAASDYFLHSVRPHLLSYRSTGISMIDALSQYVVERKTISPEADDRIQVKEE
jgi:2',3'-cyclic-nucleotide 2'-phosphodiesterase (5'-nucleotidase family)